MTIASTHAAALAVHSGSETDTPRPECAGEMKRNGASTPTLIECCSGTATTGPNSNAPVFLRWKAGDQLCLGVTSEKLLVE